MIDDTSWVVRTRDERPARMDGTCFYCQQKMGEQHLERCVIPSKSVVVQFSVDLVVDVMVDSTKDDIEFRYNEGTWCGSNLVDMLAEVEKKTGNGCLCHLVSAKYLRDATVNDHEATGFEFENRDLPPEQPE